MPEREVVVHGIYRHYKGNYYIVESISTHTETGEKMVNYRALYGDHMLWSRPYKIFISEIDSTVCPNINQKYRFELQEGSPFADVTKRHDIAT